MPKINNKLFAWGGAIFLCLMLMVIIDGAAIATLEDQISKPEKTIIRLGRIFIPAGAGLRAAWELLVNGNIIRSIGWIVVAVGFALFFTR